MKYTTSSGAPKHSNNHYYLAEDYFLFFEIRIPSLSSWWFSVSVDTSEVTSFSGDTVLKVVAGRRHRGGGRKARPAPPRAGRWGIRWTRRCPQQELAAPQLYMQRWWRRPRHLEGSKGLTHPNAPCRDHRWGRARRWPIFKWQIYIGWPNVFKWSLKNGQFSVRSMYQAFLDTNIVPHNSYLWKLKMSRYN
jgi:hypothetical protein